MIDSDFDQHIIIYRSSMECSSCWLILPSSSHSFSTSLTFSFIKMLNLCPHLLAFSQTDRFITRTFLGGWELLSLNPISTFLKHPAFFFGRSSICKPRTAWSAVFYYGVKEKEVWPATILQCDEMCFLKKEATQRRCDWWLSKTGCFLLDKHTKARKNKQKTKPQSIYLGIVSIFCYFSLPAEPQHVLPTFTVGCAYFSWNYKARNCSDFEKTCAGGNTKFDTR